MNGHLRLVFTGDPPRTVLREQSFSAPVHLSKPHWDGHHLIVNVVNPTAALFPGDVIDTTVQVGNGACAVITSPSATRVHPSATTTDPARVNQAIAIARGGWLDWIPEILIPHRGARFVQTTRFDLAVGAELLAMEMLAPGRVAAGETFAFEHVANRVDLVIDGRLAVRESQRLSPNDASLHGLQFHFSASYCASAFLVTPRLPSNRELLERFADLSSSTAHVGASRPIESVLVVKILSADSISLRRCVAAVRALAYEIANRPQPDLRKL